MKKLIRKTFSVSYAAAAAAAAAAAKSLQSCLFVSLRHVTCFIVIVALLQRSGTEPKASLGSACKQNHTVCPSCVCLFFTQVFM